MANPLGLVGVAAMVAAWVMAWVVYRARPHRPQNRRLALLLLLAGASSGPYFGLRMMLDQPGEAHAALVVGVVFLIASPAVYLRFLATLDTPLVAPLRGNAALAVLVVATLAVEALFLLDTGAFIARMEPFLFVGGWNFVMGPLFQPLPLGMLALAEMFGLVAAVSAWRRARSQIARDQTKAFAVAFGWRDLFGVAFIGAFGFVGALGTPFGETLFLVGIPLADTLFFLLLTYGILRTQLFDIDLKLKWTLRQSTVGAFFGGAFLLGSEVLEELIPVDGPMMGIAAAGMVGLALRPVQRIAVKFADRVMPVVQETPAYIDSRKSVIYRSALEDAAADGTITDKERGILDGLRRSLGIDASAAREMEREVLASRGVAA